MLSGWRIAAPRHAKTPEEMLSGEGAYLYGGRWNSKGTRLVYLGSSKAQSAMELLVHLDKSSVIGTYHSLQVNFPDDLVSHIDPDELPNNWSDASMASSVMAVGDSWVRDQGSVILRVPSAAVMGETNYLFNPEHPDAGKITVGEIELFDFDPRVVKS
jgi:RES domain-containing protein